MLCFGFFFVFCGVEDGLKMASLESGKPNCKIEVNDAESMNQGGREEVYSFIQQVLLFVHCTLGTGFGPGQHHLNKWENNSIHVELEYWWGMGKVGD